MLDIQSRTWEKFLLSLAHEARHLDHHEPETGGYDQQVLVQAYAHCEAMTARHSRSFFLASRLLPLEKRQAARALYAFCRTTDDIVDEANDDTASRLAYWREIALSWNPPQTDLVALAWTDARRLYRIPRRYAEQLIEGVRQDLYKIRYQTFEELTYYCYRVASTVGLMSMHITGFAGDEAIPYAVKLGVALQLTNILRDVAEDWQMGRVYLPQDELAAFNLSEADIAQGQVTEAWRAFMRFQIERTRRLYDEAWPGIALLAPEGRLAIVAAAEFYRGILDDTEAHDYDVFSRRAHLTAWEKLRKLPQLWWKTRQLDKTTGQLQWAEA